MGIGYSTAAVGQLLAQRRLPDGQCRLVRLTVRDELKDVLDGIGEWLSGGRGTMGLAQCTVAKRPPECADRGTRTPPE